MLHGVWTWEWEPVEGLALSCCDRRPLLAASRTDKSITHLFCLSCFTFLFFFPLLLSSVLRKGQVVTSYYRWLQRRGGYLWIQSSATVSINHKAPHERNVIWVNYVLRSVAWTGSPWNKFNSLRHLQHTEDDHANTVTSPAIWHLYINIQDGKKNVFQSYKITH